MITAQGLFSPEVYTSKGIGLGDSYFDLISAYGYPEVLQSVSDGLKITYSDDDIVFHLKNLRVAEITIGQLPAPTTTATTTRTRTAASTAPPGTPGRAIGGRRPQERQMMVR
jgi:hypothetical protein